MQIPEFVGFQCRVLAHVFRNPTKELSIELVRYVENVGFVRFYGEERAPEDSIQRHADPKVTTKVFQIIDTVVLA